MKSTASLSKLMHRRHLKVVRTIGYVLTLGSRDAWFGLIPVLMARLDTHERAALAFTVLKSMDPETALLTVQAVMGEV